MLQRSRSRRQVRRMDYPRRMAAGALLSAAAVLTSCGGAQTPSLATPSDAPGDAPSSTAAASSGPSAPNFTLPTLDGKKVRLSDHLGKKVILLDFWHTTCHPCIQELPELVKLYRKYNSRGFVVMGITTDGPETRADVTSVVRDNAIDFPILLDEETAVQDRYNPKGELPFTVLINRSGAIVLKRASYQAGDEKSMQQLVDAIEAALAEP